MYAIKPYMDQIEGIQSWDVDLDSPEKEVEVVTDSDSPKKMRKAVEKGISKAGYKAKLIK
jgi:copper chaperone CopZ